MVLKRICSRAFHKSEESTLSRELKRNSTDSGKYLWHKAHQKAMARRERTKRNGRLAPELVWRIKELIIREQWSPQADSRCATQGRH